MFSTILIVAALASPVFSFGFCPTPPVAPIDFDINKYTGRWYEIVRPNLEITREVGISCVTTDFTPREDGNFNVTNLGVKNGEKVIDLGFANRLTEAANVLEVGAPQRSSTVKFYIAETDYETYAAVYTCVGFPPLITINTGWILSRKPTLDAEITQKLTDLLVNYYDIKTSELEVTQHVGCTYPPA